jgi:two-component system, response regulator RegA
MRKGSGSASWESSQPVLEPRDEMELIWTKEATGYLSKPVDADDVVAALLALEGRRAEPPENPMSADRVRWEHIQRIYELCGRNVSETARRLNMHRRSLQRILAKRAPK